MLNSLFAIAKPSKGIALPLTCLLMGGALPAIAQSSEALPSLSGSGSVFEMPPPSSTASDWSLTGPQPNIVVLPGVSQSYIDRVLSSTVSAPVFNDSDVNESDLNESDPVEPGVISIRSSVNRDQRVSTACRYSPSVGESNLLGENASFTVTEFGDSTIFRYQLLADASGATSDRTISDAGNDADILYERFLILSDTSLPEARRQLVGSRDRYAQFLGLPANNALIRRGFGPINRLLSCN